MLERQGAPTLPHAREERVRVTEWDEKAQPPEWDGTAGPTEWDEKVRLTETVLGPFLRPYASRCQVLGRADLGSLIVQVWYQ